MNRNEAVQTFVSLAIALSIMSATACERENRAPTEPGEPAFDLTDDSGAEGELLGHLFLGSSRNAESGFTVTIVPLDTLTKSRLRGTERDSSVMVAKPGGWAPKGWDFEWFDPAGGGGCGGLNSYEAEQSVNGEHYRWTERHTTDPNPGLEVHCIRPGNYRFTLREGGVTKKTFQFEYGQAGALVSNVTAGVNEYVIAPTYDRSLTVRDLIINIDLQDATFTEIRQVDIENALADPFKVEFQGQTSPSGAASDYFRFSLAGDTSGWNYDSGKGTMLTRLYFDRGQNDGNVTRYYDPISQEGARGIMINRYNKPQYPVVNRYARIGLEMMRPDEDPDGEPVVLDSVFISDLKACFVAERDTVWENSAQYLNASCSTGPNRQYSWQTDAGGSFTAFSSDTLLDLTYSLVGRHTVTLKVKNTATGATTVESMDITVVAGALSVYGPTYVVNKDTLWYTTSLASRWDERWPPNPIWWGALVTPDTDFRRIWPAGNYSVDLRADSSTAGVLRRGQVRITVCATGCGPELLMASSTLVSDGEEWGFFGGGPWLSWGDPAQPQVIRFYDLTGEHHRRSPFGNASWFENPATRTVSELGASLQWRGLNTNDDAIRAFEFAVSRGGDYSAYVFGFAWDPDLGAPADDRSGYDSGRNMVYVTDAAGAVGCLLLENGRNDLAGVEQYGVGKRPPARQTEMYETQRRIGVRLVSGERDVQFMLASRPKVGPRSWTVVFLKGKTLTEIQNRADAAVVLFAKEQLN